MVQLRHPARSGPPLLDLGGGLEKSTKFWQAWTLEDNMPLYSRKHFKPDQVIAAITEAHNDVPGSLKCLAETLHKETIKLKRMQSSKNENI